MKDFIAGAFRLVNHHPGIIPFYVIAQIFIGYLGKNPQMTLNSAIPLFVGFLGISANAVVSAYYILTIRKKRSATTSQAVERFFERIGPILLFAVIYILFSLTINESPLTHMMQARYTEFIVSLLTIFVLPMLLFETRNPLIAIKESIILMVNNLGSIILAFLVLIGGIILVSMLTMAVFQKLAIGAGPYLGIVYALFLMYFSLVFNGFVCLIFTHSRKR